MIGLPPLVIFSKINLDNLLRKERGTVGTLAQQSKGYVVHQLTGARYYGQPRGQEATLWREGS